MAKLLLCGIIVALLLSIGAATVYGAKGGKRALLAEPGISVPDGVFGGYVVASVSPGMDSLSYVKAECFQKGEVVFRSYSRVNEENRATIGFGRTQLWNGGDAECSAEYGVFQYWGLGSWQLIAATAFYVSG